MSVHEIYTAFNVPAVSSSPSINSIQWNANGQVCFATKTAVYILTPELGINFDLSSATRADIVSESHTSDTKASPALRWFKTMIEFNKRHTPHTWTETSQEWGALALGSLDIVLRAIACSPSSLASPDARCAIATLTSNMDLALWVATKNHLKGEWFKAADITELLIAHFNGTAECLSHTAKTLHAQTTCITWSQQPNFGITPTPLCDGSLLVAGNRAGSLIFLRLIDESSEAIQIVHTLNVSEKWITHVAFSTWVSVETNKCKAYVAYGLSDGAVGLVEVTQTLHSTISAFGPEHAVDIIFEAHNHRPYDADKRGITGLAWVSCPEHKRILVHCKPGVVHLWLPSTTIDSPQSGSHIGWSGYRTLSFRTQRLSVGSSCLHSVSGLYHVRRRDALVISLFDGSFHVIYNLSSEPVLSSTVAMDGNKSSELMKPFTTETLSTASRAIFALTEKREVQHAEVNRIGGMLAYDDFSGTVLWLHEASRPADFSYKHDAQQNSVFVMARMWDDSSDVGSADGEEDNQVLKELREILNGTILGYEPIHLLRSIFLYLRDDEKRQRLHQSILEILSLHPVMVVDPSLSASGTSLFATSNIGPALPSWRGDVTLEMRQSFRKSLRLGLFGWSDLLSLQMRLSLADYCWKLSQDDSSREECGLVAEQLLSAISYRVLRTIVQHLMAVVEILSSNDGAFVTKIISRSMFPGAPPDLAREAQRLSEAAHFEANVSSETCPACGTDIPMSDLNNAVCANGHAWVRCSVTSFVLSTPMVRTCVGCSRKVLSPPLLHSSASDSGTSGGSTVEWVPAEAAQSWVVQELLAAVCRCLFCGNSFVSVL